MIKFKKGKVAIWWCGHEKEVDAYVHGNLAVHKIPTEAKSHIWSITHVPTGFCVGGDFPPFSTMKEAKEMVEELVKTDDWSIQATKFGVCIDINNDRADALVRILRHVWYSKCGIQYVENGSDDYTEVTSKELLPQSKCVQCGKDSERLILSQYNGKYGWYTWCCECMPYDKSIEKEEGKLTRW